MESTIELPRRRPRSLALELVEALGDRIRDGRLAAGEKLRTEAEFMAEFGVSRTVVREAISKLQASGLVQTRHGIGTFVVGLGEAAPFRLAPEQFATLRDVIAVLELRIGIETEAASHGPRDGPGPGHRHRDRATQGSCQVLGHRFAPAQSAQRPR